MSDKQPLIDEFISVVSCTPEQATFYLEASNWNLQTALGSFYDNPAGGDEELPDYGIAQTSASALAGNLGPFLSGSGVNAFGNDDNSTPAAASVSSSRSKPSQPQGRMRTLKDLAGDESDDSEEPQNMFAGGKQSGMAVQNPGKKGKGSNPLIDNILKKAAEGGTVSSEEQEAPTQKPSFGGAGYRLGSEESASTPSRSAVPAASSEVHEDALEPISRTLTFWRNGFTVEDGPLLAYDDPANQETLKLIDSGRAPLALLNVRQDQPVDVRVAKRQDEDYIPPKVVMKPFSGEGQRLGSIVPQVSRGTSASTTQAPPPASSSSIPMLSVDPSQPITSLQIRLADGTRMVSKFNTTHTVQDVRDFINASRAGESSRPYVLQTTFPTKDLTDEKLSLQEAGLVNTVVVQRRT